MKMRQSVLATAVLHMLAAAVAPTAGDLASELAVFGVDGCVPIHACTAVRGPDEWPPVVPTCAYVGPKQRSWQDVVCFGDPPAGSCTGEGGRFLNMCPAGVGTTTVEPPDACDRLGNDAGDAYCADVLARGGCESAFFQGRCRYSCSGCEFTAPSQTPTRSPSPSPTPHTERVGECYSTATCAEDCAPPCGWDSTTGVCSPEGETSDLELYLRLGNCPTAPPTQVPSASPTVRVTQITTTVTTTTTTSTATTVTVPDPCMVLVRLALNDSELLEVCDRAERCTPQRNGGGMVCRQKTCTDFRISEACTNATWVGCDFDTNYSACHPAGEQVPCSSIQTEQADDCNNYTHPGASCIYVGGLCYDNNVDVPCSAYFDDATCPSSRCTFAFFNFESGYGECSATMTTQAPPVQTYNECELIPPTAMATCLNTADDLNCIFDYLLGDAGGCRSMSCRDHRDAEDCVSGTGCEYLDGFQLCHEVGAPVPCGSFQNNDTCDRTRCQYVGNTCHELGAVLPCWTYGRDAEACPTSPSDGQSDSRCAVMGGWCTAPLVSRSPSVAPTTAPSRVPTANPSPGRTTTTATTETSTSSTETSSTGMTTGTTETSTTTMATLTTATTGTTDTTATGDGMLVRTFLLVSDSNLASTLGQMGPAGRDQFGEQLGAAIAELVNSDDASSFNFKAEQVQVSNIRADVNVVELSVTARDPILIESVIHKMARLLGLQAGPFMIAPLGVGDSGDGSGLATPQTTTSDSSAAWTDASQDAEDSTSDWSKSAVYALVVGGSCALFLVVVLANTMCVRSGSRGAEDVTGKDDAKAFGFGNPGFKQTLASSSLREVFGSSLNLDPYSSLEPHSVDNSSPDPYDTNNFGTPTPRASPAALWDQVLAVRPQMPTVESVTEAKSVTVNKQTGIKPGSLGLKFGPTPGIGLRVNGVTEGASAALTGQIAVGDVIQFINGIDVRNMQMADVMPILGQREAVVLRIVGSRVNPSVPTKR